tara:strand:+ start:835 stop:1056 length:222 start_codon:yes stop_codon:yes gene_type:complete
VAYIFLSFILDRLSHNDYIVNKKEYMNTLLVIGICFMTIGFLGVIVSEIMISHYDRKLYQLEKRRKEALGVRK